MITVILAGTPHSGLSCLRQLLGGHSQVFVSPLVGLHAHGMLWGGNGEEWRQALRAIVEGTSSMALPQRCPLAPAVNQHALRSLGLDGRQMIGLIEGSHDGHELVATLREVVVALQGPAIWLEAAHTNLYGVAATLRAEAGAKAVVTRRDGATHLAALVAAGHGFKEAARAWFAEAALSRWLAEQWPERVRLVSHGELAGDAKAVAQMLYAWLGLEQHEPQVCALDADVIKSASLPERWLAYLAGLKLAPEFATLIDGAPVPAWRGLELLAWSGVAVLEEGLRAREELEQAEQTFNTARGRLLSSYVRFSATKQSGSQQGAIRRVAQPATPKEPSQSGLGRRIRNWFFPASVSTSSVPAAGSAMVGSASARSEPELANPQTGWDWRNKTPAPPAAGSAEIMAVILLNGRAQCARRTVQALGASAARTPATGVVLVAESEEDWQCACALQREQPRTFPVAAPGGQAGASWQAGVLYARAAAPKVVLVLEPGQLPGAEYLRQVWRLLDEGRGAAGPLGFDLVAAAAWTLVDEQPESDHEGREWGVQLHRFPAQPEASIGRAYAASLLERMEWKLTEELCGGQVHENAWQRAMVAQAHNHLLLDGALLRVLRTETGLLPAALAGQRRIPRDFLQPGQLP